MASWADRQVEARLIAGRLSLERRRRSGVQQGLGGKRKGPVDVDVVLPEPSGPSTTGSQSDCRHPSARVRVRPIGLARRIGRIQSKLASSTRQAWPIPHA